MFQSILVAWLITVLPSTTGQTYDGYKLMEAIVSMADREMGAETMQVNYLFLILFLICMTGFFPNIFLYVYRII